MKTNKYLLFSVFFSGMTTLAIELTASRLLGNVFGTSNLVWASIIGLILIYLTIGYFLGGKYADKHPSLDKYFQLMLLGGYTAGLVPILSRPVLRFAAQAFDELSMGILVGSFVAVLILFVVPITLLGMISPFAIRLAITDPAEAGQISGKIYAISTFGSFVGTFLPVLILIPALGTARTFLVFSFSLMFVALIGLWGKLDKFTFIKWLIFPLSLGIISYFLLQANIKQTPGQIFEVESGYNYIEVIENKGFTQLRLNDGQGVHSIYHPEIIKYDGPWMQFLAAPFFNLPNYSIDDVNSMAIVGLAAGTTARQATEVFGPILIDGYEIDETIIEVGKEYFGMTMSNLNTFAVDGRWGLDHSENTYDIIAVDAYRPPYIPWHLTTVEFFQVTYDRLSENGVLVINVGRAPHDRGLIDALVTTLKQIYPSIHIMDIPNTFNSMVYATKQETSMQNMATNYLHLNQDDTTPQLLLDSMFNVVAYRQINPTPTIVLTDDKAPIESIINRMVLTFIFTGEYEALK
jgi:spermidine synthase